MNRECGSVERYRLHIQCVTLAVTPSTTEDAQDLLETDKEVVALNGYFGKLTLNDCAFRSGFTTGYLTFGVAESYLTDVYFDAETAVSMQPLLRNGSP